MAHTCKLRVKFSKTFPMGTPRLSKREVKRGTYFIRLSQETGSESEKGGKHMANAVNHMTCVTEL